jgi:hypothetical protein
MKYVDEAPKLDDVVDAGESTPAQTSNLQIHSANSNFITFGRSMSSQMSTIELDACHQQSSSQISACSKKPAGVGFCVHATKLEAPNTV